MKGLRNFLIIGLIISIVAVCVSYVKLGGDVNNFWAIYADESQYTKVDNSYGAAGYNININIGSANVVISQGEDSQLKLSYYESDTRKFIIEEADNAFTIRQDYSNLFDWTNLFAFPKFISKEMNTILIQLPSTVGDVDVQIGSGKLNCSDIKAKEVNCGLASGAVELTNLVADKIFIDVSSGKVTATNIVSSQLGCDLSSGFVQLNKVNSDKIDVDIASGRVECQVVGVQSEYLISMNKASGETYLQGTKFEGTQIGSTNREIKVDVSSGVARVTFVNE